MTKGIIAVIFLFVSLYLIPLAVDFKITSQAKAAGWWGKVSEGGLKDVAPVYGQTGGTPPRDIRIMAARLIRVVLELLGLIALAVIISGGFKWMTANGDEDKVESAKKQLTNGAVGLLIIIVAFAIATFVLNQLIFITTGIQPVSWSW